MTSKYYIQHRFIFVHYIYSKLDGSVTYRLNKYQSDRVKQTRHTNKHQVDDDIRINWCTEQQQEEYIKFYSRKQLNDDS